MINISKDNCLFPLFNKEENNNKISSFICEVKKFK